MPRLPCGTRSRWTCVIPDSRSTPSEQNWNLTFSQLIDLFFGFSFIYFIIYSFFSSQFAPLWCLLAGANKCLNWIELHWTKLAQDLVGMQNCMFCILYWHTFTKKICILLKKICIFSKYSKLLLGAAITLLSAAIKQPRLIFWGFIYFQKSLVRYSRSLNSECGFC